jgi:hypothetical protein
MPQDRCTPSLICVFCPPLVPVIIGPTAADQQHGLNQPPDKETSMATQPAWQRKQHAEDALAVALDNIASEKREPDAWESEHLLAAIGALTAHMYVLAVVLVDKALAAPGERSGSWPRDSDCATVSALRAALHQVSLLAAPNVQQ